LQAESRDSGAALVYQDFADWQAVARELAGGDGQAEA
jgi:hypothetical protein